MAKLLLIAGDGLVYAAWLFLVSVGLTFIYGVLRILNVAHGSLYALGAYCGASLVIAYYKLGVWPEGSYILLLSVGLIGAVFGLVLERAVMKYLYGRDPVIQLLATFAVFLVLEDVIKIVWGVDPYYAYKPYSLLGDFRVGSVVYPRYFLLLIVMAVAAGLLLGLFVQRSRFGRMVVAVIHDPEMSAAMGINLRPVYLAAFAFGAALAALGGAFTAPMISVVPGIGVEVIVQSFAVVAIGGLGSLSGAALGALIVGLVRAAAVHLAPELEVFTIYLVMAAVLLFRPQGLFAGAEARRV